MSYHERLLVGLFLTLLIVLMLWLGSCSFLPTLRHPRASQEIDFTKTPAEIPEQFDLTPL